MTLSRESGNRAQHLGLPMPAWIKVSRWLSPRKRLDAAALEFIEGQWIEVHHGHLVDQGLAHDAGVPPSTETGGPEEAQEKNTGGAVSLGSGELIPGLNLCLAVIQILETAGLRGREWFRDESVGPHHQERRQHCQEDECQEMAPPSTCLRWCPDAERDEHQGESFNWHRLMLVKRLSRSPDRRRYSGGKNCQVPAGNDEGDIAE